MKKIFAIISIISALITFSSCNKGNNDGAVMSYYMYSIDRKTNTGNYSATNTSAIEKVLNERSDSFYNMSESQAQAEWKSFVAAVDDSKVVIETDQEYYSVALVKISVYEKNELETESKVVATVGKKTWRKGGAVEE